MANLLADLTDSVSLLVAPPLYTFTVSILQNYEKLKGYYSLFGTTLN